MITIALMICHTYLKAKTGKGLETDLGCFTLIADVMITNLTFNLTN